MGEFGDDYKYPVKKEPSSKPLLGGQNVGPDGADGENAIFAVAFTNNILIPTDSDGTNPVYTDAITEFEVWEGNTMLAKKSALDGWTSVLYSETNVTVNDTVDLEATITAIAADHGSFIMKFDKVGYASLYCKVHAHKAKKGVPGDTGNTGDAGGTGADGPTGLTGQDGTGLVIVKKTIIMVDYNSIAATAANDSGLKFTTAQIHQLTLGDTANHSGFTNSTYNGDHKVVEIVSTTEYRIATVTYVSDDSGTFIHKSAMLPAANPNRQELMWFDMIPDGSVPLEFRLLMVTEDAGDELYATLGFKPFPTGGWNIYLNGELFEDQGNQKASPAFGLNHTVDYLRGASGLPTSRADIYLNLSPYIGKTWNSYYQNVKFNLFVAYLAYQLDVMGS